MIPVYPWGLSSKIELFSLLKEKELFPLISSHTWAKFNFREEKSALESPNAPWYACKEKKLSFELWLGCTTDSSKALLELVDTSLCIHKLLLSSKKGVRIRGNPHTNNVVSNAINFFFFCRSNRWVGYKALARGHILKDNRMVVRMDIFFHNQKE